MGVIGEKRFADELRDQIKEFLRDTLKLELSMEKTKTTNLNRDRAEFLGSEIYTQSPKESKIVTRKMKDGRKIESRVNHTRIYLDAPMGKIFKRLQERGFTNIKDKPQALAK